MLSPRKGCNRYLRSTLGISESLSPYLRLCDQLRLSESQEIGRNYEIHLVEALSPSSEGHRDGSRFDPPGKGLHEDANGSQACRRRYAARRRPFGDSSKQLRGTQESEARPWGGRLCQVGWGRDDPSAAWFSAEGGECTGEAA